MACPRFVGMGFGLIAGIHAHEAWACHTRSPAGTKIAEPILVARCGVLLSRRGTGGRATRGTGLEMSPRQALTEMAQGFSIFGLDGAIDFGQPQGSHEGAGSSRFWKSDRNRRNTEAVSDGTHGFAPVSTQGLKPPAEHAAFGYPISVDYGCSTTLLGRASLHKLDS